MALEKNELFKLAKTVAKANPSAACAYSFGDEKFSYADLNDTFRNEMNELAGTYTKFRQNKNTVFELMEEVIDDVSMLFSVSNIFSASLPFKFNIYIPSVIPILIIGFFILSNS